MKRVLIVVLATLMATGVAAAQEWLEKGQKDKLNTLSHKSADTATFVADGMLSLSFSQAHYTESWKDGVKSLGFRVAFIGSTTYTRDRIFFKNSLDVAYARSREGEAKTFLKKEDRLNFNGVWGYQVKAEMPLYWVGQLDLKTQLDKGVNGDDLTVSNFFSPAYIIASLGMRYQSSYGLSIALSPASGRFTIVADTALARYVDVDLAADPRYFRAQVGAYGQIAFDRKFKIMHLKSTIELFSNYNDNPQNVDVDWITTLTFDIHRFFSIQLFNRIIYRDKDRYTVQLADGTNETRGPAVQWAESLNIGLSYRFSKK